MFRCFLIMSCMLCACVPEFLDADRHDQEVLLAIPAHFPTPEFPEDNAFTEARWELGKMLFYDPILSRDQSISCASCHLPALAFSDSLDLSLGVAERAGTRNSPSLANVAYHPYFTREGGVPSLEMQILVPIQEHNEFDFNILSIAERLQQDSVYRTMSQLAYARDPDAFVITRSIATFERSLISGNSPYDQFEFEGKKSALSRKAKQGMELFFGEKTQCSSCHSGFNFSNYAFENNGLYVEYPDPGRFRLTNKEEDRALFKVPSLRNVAVTAPYMHDGAMPDLKTVIEHYNQGGKAHPHKSPKIRPLGLDMQEKEALIAFLESLTDESFLYNPQFRKE